MPLPVPVAVAAVVLAVVAGGLAGVLTRQWLAWLSRGAHVPVLWCVLGVGGPWGGTVVAWTAGALPVAALPLALGLAWLVVAGSAVDLAVRRLPDALTLPAAPGVLVLLIPLGVDAVTRGALAGFVLCAVHAVVRLVAPTAMGGGDVKLAAAVGAALGGMSWSALVVGTVLAAVLTALTGAVRLGVAARRARVPAGSGRAAPGSAGSGPAGFGPVGFGPVGFGPVGFGPVGFGPVGSGAAGSGAAGSGAAADHVAPKGAVPHGPSMVIACLAVVGIASTGPAVPVPDVGTAPAVAVGPAATRGPGGCPTADMTAQASHWPAVRPRVRG